MSSNLQKALGRIFGLFPGSSFRLLLLRLIGVKAGAATHVRWGAWVGRDVRLGAGVLLDYGCRLDPGAIVADGCRIGPESFIGAGVELGRDVVIGARALVANAVVGEGSHIEFGVVFTGFQDGTIRIGRHTYIGIYNVLDWSGGLTIGDHVHIAGPSVGVWTHSSVNQALRGGVLRDHYMKTVGAVRIGDNCYIGGNSTIYPGVSIGSFAVVTPNSAVNRDVPSNSMVGGTPARAVRSIRTDGAEVHFDELAQT